jgi:hypothetical protein
MATTTTTTTTTGAADWAEDSLRGTLERGQEKSIGDVSIQRADAKDAYDIMQAERSHAARRSGKRPMFIGIDLGSLP